MEIFIGSSIPRGNLFQFNDRRECLQESVAFLSESSGLI